MRTIPGLSSVLEAAYLKNCGGNINAWAGTILISASEATTREETTIDWGRCMGELCLVGLGIDGLRWRGGKRNRAS